MTIYGNLSLCVLALLLATACSPKVSSEEKEIISESGPDRVTTAIGPLELPAPYATESAVKVSKVVGWPEGITPRAPAGFTVTRYADKLENPRTTYEGPNGDLFVVESNTRSSANRITLLRDTDQDGMPDERHEFATDLDQPFGMLIMDGYFYIANTGETLRYPYKIGDTKLTGTGRKILATPPQGYNNHWTRNLLAGRDGKKIYVSVGSGSNVGENGMENETNRAMILEINPDGSEMRQFATGLRNPVGMDWNPANGELWTAVNERDKLGDELVPDYATSVKEGAFYGWPYSYYGQLPDPRWKDDPHPAMVAKAVMPDVPLGAHTASLGLAFYPGDKFGGKYRNGMFIGQHGSWNRSNFSGYKVVFVPFKSGKPGQPEDFLTGFIAPEDGSKVYGRPVGVTVNQRGDLLVADDSSGIIWRVSQGMTK